MKERSVQVLCSVSTFVPVVVGMLLFTSCESDRFDEILVAADKIGELRYKPYDDYWKVYDEYWNERIAADQEDERNGHPPKVSYRRNGRVCAGSISVMGKISRPDINKFGPRLKACEEKWRPVMEHNWDVGKQRVQAVGKLRGTLFERKSELTDEKFDNLCSNVVRRARLSPREVELLLKGK